MAIKLQDKPNVLPPGSVIGGKTYNHGQIKDDPAGVTGTPVNTLVYGDFHQFFAALIAAAGTIDVVAARVIANGLPENDSDGQQYYEALLAVIADGAKGANGAGAWIDGGNLAISCHGAGVSSMTLGTTVYNKSKIVNGNTLLWQMQYRTGTLATTGSVDYLQIPAPAPFFASGGVWKNTGAQFTGQINYSGTPAAATNILNCVLVDVGGAPYLQIYNNGVVFPAGGNQNFDINIVTEI